jgi:transposase-like protein
MMAESSPEIEKKVRRYLKSTNDSWRMDETYIRVNGGWKYLYRVVDSNGNTIDFMFETIKGIEIMHMIKKGQVNNLNRCVLDEVNFINQLSGIAA